MPNSLSAKISSKTLILSWLENLKRKELIITLAKLVKGYSSRCRFKKKRHTFLLQLEKAIILVRPNPNFKNLKINIDFPHP